MLSPLRLAVLRRRVKGQGHPLNVQQTRRLLAKFRSLRSRGRLVADLNAFGRSRTTRTSTGR